MKPRHLIFSAVIACSLTYTIAPASAHEAHVHGLGKLDVALDGHTLSLHLDSPLINLIGFEHAARNAQDRQAVQQMRQQLHSAQTLFVTSPAAQCKLTTVNLVSAALDPALLTMPPNARSAIAPATSATDKSHAEHADLDANFVFQCAHPERLQTIATKLFQTYPGFQRIDVQIVTPKRQSAVTLTPNAANIPL